MNTIDICGCSGFVTEDNTDTSSGSGSAGDGGRIQFVTGDPNSLISNIVGADAPMATNDTTYIIRDAAVSGTVNVYQAGVLVPEGGPDFHIQSVVYDDVTPKVTITFSIGVQEGLYINITWTKKAV